ncbi:unnamed protein product [Dracunculus medinensis]|uniref:F-BAR domain-containing protein n=1 Tax=Dracunculus medinensis TaxID=318479 RepID=A0A158Q4G2_DRAME|nr:unnamed protein product [Dracunculus medinensis]
MEEEIHGGFYEIGAYRHNVRRYKEGIEQLNDIQSMLKERADIESSYAKSLQTFHAKWSNYVSHLPHSTIKNVWTELLEEGSEVSKLHANVKDRISDELLKTISLYLKENHHPTAFRAPKEIREIEDDFEKAQRPWRKHYEKAEKAKKAFHLASKAERSAEIQAKNASGDSSISTDNENKFRERYQKCQGELAKSEKAYRVAINDLISLKANYISHMEDVYENCQQKELKRLKFVFEMLCGFQKVVVDVATATK